MLRLLALFTIVIAPTAELYADPPNPWLGEAVVFDAPVQPYHPGPDNPLSVTIGYGNPANTIGAGLWHSSTGVLDLTNDPGYPGFLGLATNGIEDTLYVTVWDKAGNSCSGYTYPSDGWLGGERFMFGRAGFNDMSPLPVNGVQMNVMGLYGPGVFSREGGIVVWWDFPLAPEPASIVLFLSVLMIVTRRRPHAA